ncbi:hypothetical protein EVAR_42994_1 [Eumeta japonica]|uniref:Uncharacterized protein n=1 Tax=Eumeta variegata TaxID=151549 RepID=A0A4C1WDM4_EUMVA|nr:hypothetical protein EVAR_42994_1 [Eumeta japonica]
MRHMVTAAHSQPQRSHQRATGHSGGKVYLMERDQVDGKGRGRSAPPEVSLDEMQQRKMLLHIGILRECELKLKAALLELKASKEMCDCLISERDDHETEIRSVIFMNTKLKGELAEMDEKCNDLTDQRDRLQVLVSEMDDCQNHYEQSLLQIQVLQEEDAHEIVLFADDTSLIFKVKRQQPTYDDVNNAISKVEKWFTANNLLLNEMKTKCIRFSLPNVRHGSGTISVRSKELEFVNSTVFLGITLDDRFQWGPHIKNFPVAEAGRSRNLQARTSYIP